MLALAVFLFAPTGCRAGEQPPSDTRPGQPLAFAGAQGYGAHAAGGRGGRVIAVSTLADSGKGSLRACIEESGPRVCVFRVSGVIRFTRSPPVIRNPYLTIAGQTAPGGGIILTHAGGSQGVTPLLIKQTHDIIVRDIRVRTDKRGDFRGANDAITFEDSSNVILDHVSGSWALDENINGQGQNDNVTVSWSIFAEGIPKHDKCALLGSDPTGPQRLTFIGNLCAHHGDRNPDLNFAPRSCVDVINNIFYDAQSQFAEIWESYDGTSANIVGNWMRAGPSTEARAIGIDRQRIGSSGPAKIYAADNRFDGHFVHQAEALAPVLVKQPVCPFSVDPLPVDAAYAAVLEKAGAFPRDSVDQRIIAEVRNRSGHIVRQPGDMPVIAAAQPYPDRDRDGMSDAWEQQHGSNPALADPWKDADGDGRPNLESFLDDAHAALMQGRAID